MSADAIIRMPDELRGVMLRGHPMVFLVTGENTKHTSMFDWTIPAGLAAGRHVHRVLEETFYLLEGECEWHVGEKTIRATPGTFLFLPPSVAHNITNISEKPARVLMTVSPPGHEHYFDELAKPAAQGSPDPEALAKPLRHRPTLDFDNASVSLRPSLPPFAPSSKWTQTNAMVEEYCLL
jgi:quercetin dioxygenase-like cupin family protein